MTVNTSPRLPSNVPDLSRDASGGDSGGYHILMPGDAGDADVDGRQGDDRMTNAHFQNIGRVTKNNLFWHYAYMCHKLFNVLSTMMSWSEGCSCHPDFFGRELATLTRNERAIWQEAASCPMRGHRSADMALGRWRFLFFKFAAVVPPRCSSRLLRCAGACNGRAVLDRRVDGQTVEHPLGPAGRGVAQGAKGRRLHKFHKFLLNTQPVSARFRLHYTQVRADVDIILNDFLSGCARQELVLEQKFAFWELLPWSLCGLGAPGDAEARACGASCLAAHAGNPAATAHHRVTNKFLADGSHLRTQAYKQ